MTLAAIDDSFFTPISPQILSVSEVSRCLKKTIETQYSLIKVKGEISGLKVHGSGHQYLSLKDEDAVLDGIIWRGTSLGFPIVDGMEVVATGKLTTYPGRSKYQMIIQKVEPVGEGGLLKLLMERKKKLHEQGCFDNARDLPVYPKIIGVITSPTGAVLRDILHRLEDRYPVHVLVWPVLVQGPLASDQITQAIKGFNEMELTRRPDILIVARGGGSIEDLWAFNEENVVMATHTSIIPIISAVGHETDVTLIDYAADKRAPTPTAAAEIATPNRRDLFLTLKSQQRHLHQTMVRLLTHLRLTFAQTLAGLPSFEYFILIHHQRLDDWGSKLHWLINRRLNEAKNVYQRLILPSPKLFLDRLHYNQQSLGERLIASYKNTLRLRQENLGLITMALYHCSFERTLEKGFCLITHDNVAVTSGRQALGLSTPRIQLRFIDQKLDADLVCIKK